MTDRRIATVAALFAIALNVPAGFAAPDASLPGPSAAIGCDAFEEAGAAVVDAALASVSAGIELELPRDTVIRGARLAVEGLLRTASARHAAEHGADLCIEVETFTLGAAAIVCTGDGFNAATTFAVQAGATIEAAAGSRGGRLNVHLVNDPATPDPPALSLVNGAILCTGDGGDGGGAFVVDATFETAEGLCIPMADPPMLRSIGGVGGDAGPFELHAPPGAPIELPAVSVRLGAAGDGGAAVTIGNPGGNYHAVGGAGGASLATIKAELPLDLSSPLAGGTGGSGGAAVGVPCPSPGDPDHFLAGAQQSPLGDVSITIPPILPGGDPPPPDLPNCDLYSPIVTCLVHWFKDYCFYPIGHPPQGFTICGLVKDFTGIDLYGADGTDVEGHPGDGGHGTPAQPGSDGSYSISYSAGVGGLGGTPGATASVTCGGTTDGGGGGTGGAGGHATDAGVRGGNGGPGVLAGGDGGNAYAQGADGGKGGKGGKGGDGKSGSCLLFFMVADPGPGGGGGLGGDSSGGQVTGGDGGNSPVSPGKGGDGSATGGHRGVGGDGGDGGTGASWWYCAEPGPEGSCYLYEEHHEAPGTKGCGGPSGAERAVNYVGGGGGYNTITGNQGVHGTPLSQSGAVATPPGPQYGSNGQGSDNPGCSSSACAGAGATLRVDPPTNPHGMLNVPVPGWANLNTVCQAADPQSGFQPPNYWPGLLGPPGGGVQ